MALVLRQKGRTLTNKVGCSPLVPVEAPAVRALTLLALTSKLFARLSNPALINLGSRSRLRNIACHLEALPKALAIAQVRSR